MPRRTNEFQRLIALIEAQLAPDAVVRESVLLRDGKSGQQREVDLLIEAASGVHTIRIAVECQDRSRSATAEWIDQLHGKYRDLEVDKVIAVAREGFTLGARKKAEALGIETLALEEADALDWPREIAQIQEIEGLEVDVAIESASLAVDDSDAPMIKHLPSAVHKIPLYDEAGESLGSVADLAARALLQQPDVNERLAQSLGEVVRYRMFLSLNDRVFLQGDPGERQRLHGGEVLIAFRSRRIVNAPARRATYGQAGVVYGAVDLRGERVDVALAVKPQASASFKDVAGP
jgi:hypothetical protein